MSGHRARRSEAEVLRVFEQRVDVTTIELADALGCDLSAAYWWRRTLAECKLIVPGSLRRPAKAGGKASQAWCLKPRLPRPRLAREGDRVITPSNRAGVVLEIIDGRCEVEFTEGEGCTSIVPALLAIWPKGAERPQPVRVRA